MCKFCAVQVPDRGDKLAYRRQRRVELARLYASSLDRAAAASSKSRNILQSSERAPRIRSAVPLVKHSRLKDSEHNIRVFRLKPRSTAREPVACTLINIERSVWPLYTALSYAWKERGATGFRDVLVDNRRLKISQNLFEFLSIKSLDRTADATQLYWTDQICIDQSNVKERGHQVAQMGRIYATADQMIIWLGSGLHDNPRFEGPEATAALNAVYDELLKVQYSDRCNKAWETTRNVVAECSSDRRILHFLQILGRRMYWTRLWTLQELILSMPYACTEQFEHRCPVVQYGTASLPLARLGSLFALCWKSNTREAVKLLSRHEIHHQLLDAASMFEAIQIRSRYLKDSYGQDFDYSWKRLVPISKTKFSQKPQDKIFGLLALVPLTIRIPANYKVCLTKLLLSVLEAEVRYKPRSKHYDEKEHCCPFSAYLSFAEDLQTILAQHVPEHHVMRAICSHLDPLMLYDQSKRCKHASLYELHLEGWSLQILGTATCVKFDE